VLIDGFNQYSRIGDPYITSLAVAVPGLEILRVTCIFRPLTRILAIGGTVLFAVTALAMAADGTITRMGDKGVMVYIGDREHPVAPIIGTKVRNQVTYTDVTGGKEITCEKTY